MKKLLTLPVIAALAMSCGGNKPKVEEQPKPENPIQALADAAKDMQQGTDAATKKMNERKAKGDTLAMHYSELIKYLPESIDGYKREEPTGSSVNIPGMSTSTAEVTFRKDNGDRIKVTLVDYNAAYNMYTAATAMWAMGMSVDTPDEIARGVKMDNDIAGWEEFRKKSKDATLTLGVGYRFWLQVEANNQDGTDGVKSIAKSIDLSKLAAL